MKRIVECSSCKRNHRNTIENSETGEMEFFGKCKKCQLKFLKDKQYFIRENNNLLPGWRLWVTDTSQKFDLPGHVTPAFTTIQECLEYVFVKFGLYLFEKMNIQILNE